MSRRLVGSGSGVAGTCFIEENCGILQYILRTLSAKLKDSAPLYYHLSHVHLNSFATELLGPRTSSLCHLLQRGVTLLVLKRNHLRDFLPLFCLLFALSKGSSLRSLFDAVKL